jgi:TonB family protein
MSTVLNFYEQMTSARYGSMELKRVVGPNLIRGLLVSAFIHFSIVIAPYVARMLAPEEEIPPPPIRVVDISQLTKLKSMQETSEQVKIAQTQMALPTAAIPIAVEEDEILVDDLQIAKQSDIIYSSSSGSGDDLGISKDEVIQIVDENEGKDDIPDASDFVPFEVAPQPLPDFYKQPSYPAMAQKAGVKGRVIVQVYVDKKGHVLKHNIIDAKPDNLGFQDEVEKVIYGWKFTPAIQNGKPVGVWVQIPVNFTLSN